MYNPEKEFSKLIIDCLGKEGKSISALSKDLEEKGLKIHRLIITGYLRALTDQGILKEKEIPPSKIYIPVKQTSESIYESVTKICRAATPDSDELILYVLYRLLKRPIFESELRMCNIIRPIGILASDHEIAESKRVLKRAGNIIQNEKAYSPDKEYPDTYNQVLSDLLIDAKGAKHLVLETKQTKLI